MHKFIPNERMEKAISDLLEQIDKTERLEYFADYKGPIESHEAQSVSTSLQSHEAQPVSTSLQSNEAQTNRIAYDQFFELIRREDINQLVIQDLTEASTDQIDDWFRPVKTKLYEKFSKVFMKRATNLLWDVKVNQLLLIIISDSEPIMTYNVAKKRFPHDKLMHAYFEYEDIEEQVVVESDFPRPVKR